MKYHHIYKEDEKELSIQLISENQIESELIVTIANRIAAPAYSYGRVGSQNTWAWIMIPLKTTPYTKEYFGTRTK